MSINITQDFDLLLSQGITSICDVCRKIAQQLALVTNIEEIETDNTYKKFHFWMYEPTTENEATGYYLSKLQAARYYYDDLPTISRKKSRKASYEEMVVVNCNSARAVANKILVELNDNSNWRIEQPCCMDNRLMYVESLLEPVVVKRKSVIRKVELNYNIEDGIDYSVELE
jgi:hypothetical protein